MAEPSTRNFGDSLFREIHKNSWLTRVPPKESKKKRERVWTVFCIHDEAEAYLETYSNNKAAILHKPDRFIALNDTKNISPTICAHEQEFEFVINLKNEAVRLAAPTWELMLDWVESLRGKLYELRILNPKENLYSKLPEPRSAPLLPTRDPTSPLPPPPPVPLALPPGVEPLATTESRSIASTSSVDHSESSSTSARVHTTLQRGISLPERTGTVGTCSSEGVTVVTVNSCPREVFNFDLSDIDNSLPNTNTSSSDTQNAHYDQVFQLHQSPGPSSRQIRIQRSNSSPRRLQPPPQPCRTLREQQVLELQKEIKHPAGVRLQIRKKDCISSIALGDALGGVWVCGWKQKEHPMLYNFLHIGDKLVSIEGLEVHSASDAYKILRSANCGLYVNMIIKRVPYGQVYVIRRDIEGQPLGIIQEGNTAVIQTVQPGSLAARHGLPAKAPTCDGLSFTNWVLTEINGRPLNLFFKENQIKDRLNSVGRDISILVQPLDLIKQLKKQLKSIRNYKDYILQ
ncbi:hypothetical protein ILUMI_23418 [Ignelater luminosus]|uniref:PH domain-containing protein n=1 Tax=Ignelater luminosus TaxID=2038154 RepID=A0A8K0CAY8_IGNLU|nr:hypothetical protein ILUMI_23418 [Ignelater luminosus]